MKVFSDVARYQAIVTREQHQDQLLYVVELADGAVGEELAQRLADALKDQVKVRGEVQIAPAGTIALGAKKIDDRRVWK